MSTENEKIVPLNEDSNSHVQDDASYQKLMKQQEEQRKRMAEREKKD